MALFFMEKKNADSYLLVCIKCFNMTFGVMITKPIVINKMITNMMIEYISQLAIKSNKKNGATVTARIAQLIKNSKTTFILFLTALVSSSQSVF